MAKDKPESKPDPKGQQSSGSSPKKTEPEKPKPRGYIY